MNVIIRGLGYLKIYRLLAIGAFTSMLLVTATNLVTPQLFQLLIDDGIEGQSWNAIIYATVFFLFFHFSTIALSFYLIFDSGVFFFSLFSRKPAITNWISIRVKLGSSDVYLCNKFLRASAF